MRVPTPGTATFFGQVFVPHPEHGDERHACLDQATSHEQAHAVDVLTVALTQFQRFAFDVEGVRRAAGGQQVKGALLLLRVVLDRHLVIEFATRLVHRRQQRFAVLHARRRDATAHRDGRRGKLQRLLEAAIEKERIMLHANAPRELSGACEGQLARLVRQRDGIR